MGAKLPVGAPSPARASRPHLSALGCWWSIGFASPRAVARGPDALRDALARFADAEDPVAARRLRDGVVRLSGGLEAHLDREEAQLVPVLDRLRSLPEGM